MDQQYHLPDDIIRAFHVMWDNFPEPVSLVHKSRTVMAVNKAHVTLGYIKPGMNCAKTGLPGSHRGCLADRAVASKKAVYCFRCIDEKEIIGYWIPLDDYPEFFVHFGVGSTINYKSEQDAADLLLATPASK